MSRKGFLFATDDRVYEWAYHKLVMAFIFIEKMWSLWATVFMEENALQYNYTGGQYVIQLTSRSDYYKMIFWNILIRYVNSLMYYI